MNIVQEELLQLKSLVENPEVALCLWYNAVIDELNSMEQSMKDYRNGIRMALALFVMDPFLEASLKQSMEKNYNE